MHIHLNVKHVWLNDKVEKNLNQIPFSGTILRNQSLKNKFFSKWNIILLKSWYVSIALFSDSI